MPRDIFFQPSKKENLHIVERKITPIQGGSEKTRQDEILRRSRSNEYMKAVKQLDATGQKLDPSLLQSLQDQLKMEFPEVPIYALLLGIVSKCYLGDPYEVHTLDTSGQWILEHYKRGETLPVSLEKARKLAMHGSYEFIEVYSDCLRAIRENGEVSVIGGIK
ncbi:hypothetical protein [Risungbinella massiliensis]|uniref:hypothetical protein n=1 Tax=Risungbinella massiliensis TaxID=1329796 RepID=UPI00069B87D3|nr:hypothetical protein [Risungbinella massiliensis]